MLLLNRNCLEQHVHRRQNEPLLVRRQVALHPQEERLGRLLDRQQQARPEERRQGASVTPVGQVLDVPQRDPVDQDHTGHQAGGGQGGALLVGRPLELRSPTDEADVVAR